MDCPWPDRIGTDAQGMSVRRNRGGYAMNWSVTGLSFLAAIVSVVTLGSGSPGPAVLGLGLAAIVSLFMGWLDAKINKRTHL
jgi:hypothetical protein